LSGPKTKKRAIKSTLDALRVGVNYRPYDFGMPLGAVGRVAVVSVLVLAQLPPRAGVSSARSAERRNINQGVPRRRVVAASYVSRREAGLAVQPKVLEEALHTVDLVGQRGVRSGVEHPRHGDDAGDAAIGGALIVGGGEGVGKGREDGEFVH